MTGPEHYQEAERIIALVWGGTASDTLLSEPKLIALAQVHATLAQAAATAMTVAQMPDPDFVAWDKVCGVDVEGEVGARG